MPEELAAILEKMMAKDPAERYQTPTEVAEALAPWTQTPIPPPPEEEMPQLSLAAMGGGVPGSDATRAGASSDPPSGTRKPWQVSNGSPSSSAPATAPPAVAPSAPAVAPRKSGPTLARGAAAVGRRRPSPRRRRPPVRLPAGAARRQGSGAPGPLARAAATGARPGPAGRRRDARPRPPPRR